MTTRLLLFIALICAYCLASEFDFDFQSPPDPFGREKRQTRACGPFDKDCNPGASRNRGQVRPNYRSQRCDYEDHRFWLIPGEADNTTCTRPEVVARGLKIRIYNDTVKISPEPIVLPACFNISFEVEITPEVENIPRSFIGKNIFQLYELPEIENMQCQNASNNGCGGFGNNCIYCDVCDSLDDLQEHSRKSEPWLNQFSDIKCPDQPGRYLVTRRMCFNDWSVLDKDGNCKLDFIEQLEKETKPNDGTNKTNFDSLDAAWRMLNQKGHSTFIARFYLAHNATPAQLARKEAKEKDIEEHWNRELLKRRRAGWQVSDAEFENFRTWYIKLQQDTWHKEKYLPWLMYQNEMACLKVHFTVCDKEPKAISSSSQSSGPKGWWERRVQQKYECPS